MHNSKFTKYHIFIIAILAITVFTVVLDFMVLSPLGAQLLRLLESDDDEGATYTAQYFATSKELQEKYIAEFSASLREKAFAKWGNRFISFRSVMELVQ